MIESSVFPQPHMAPELRPMDVERFHLKRSATLSKGEREGNVPTVFAFFYHDRALF